MPSALAGEHWELGDWLSWNIPSCVIANSAMTNNTYRYTKKRRNFAVHHEKKKTTCLPDIVERASSLLQKKEQEKKYCLKKTILCIKVYY